MARPRLRNGPIKKKTSPLKSAKIKTIDYKDTALPRKSTPDHGRIHARRVTDVPIQEQCYIVHAMKNAHEIALLLYSSTDR